MIPLAVRLREMNYNVIAGAGEEHLNMFRNEMPGISCIAFPGFRPRYSRFLPQYLAIFLQIPSLIYHIVSEHVSLKKIIRDNGIDIVISDNRFGLWNRKIRTVYVTHQIRIPFPGILRFLEFSGILLHRAIINKYSLCLIPDLPDNDINLSGRLSHGIKLPENTIYTGILSRFTEMVSRAEDSPAGYRHNTVILSGPEPQRSIFSHKLEVIMKKKEPKTVFLNSLPETGSSEIISENIVFINNLGGKAMKELISGSEGIISRSGYTSLMELVSLNRSALLVPTPGQTEQECLALWMREKGWFISVPQKGLKEPLPETGIRKIPAEEIISQSRSLLEEALKRISEDQKN